MYLNIPNKHAANLIVSLKKSFLYRVVVRRGATGAIAPIHFGKEAHIAPVSQDSIVIIAPVD